MGPEQAVHRFDQLPEFAFALIRPVGQIPGAVFAFVDPLGIDRVTHIRRGMGVAKHRCGKKPDRLGKKSAKIAVGQGGLAVPAPQGRAAKHPAQKGFGFVLFKEPGFAQHARQQGLHRRQQRRVRGVLPAKAIDGVVPLHLRRVGQKLRLQAVKYHILGQPQLAVNRQPLIQLAVAFQKPTQAPIALPGIGHAHQV